MNSISLYAKSALDLDQVKTRYAVGCDGIEYQMLESDFVCTTGELYDEQGVFDLLKAYPANSIHVANPVADIEDRRDFAVAQRKTAADLAQLSANETGKRCLLILHTETHPEQLAPVILAEIGHELEQISILYPEVDVAIENTTAFRQFQHGASHLSSGYYDANVEYAKMFPALTHAGRLGTCLDICHALITEKYFTAIFELYGETPFDISLKAFFEMNTPYLKTIHLAGFNGNGYGTGRHGTALEAERDEDVALAGRFAELYRMFAYDRAVPVTLEVTELDIMNPIGYESTKTLVERYFSDMGTNIEK